MQKTTIKQINKIIMLFLSIFLIFGFKTPETNTRENLVEYNGPIEHLTFNTLISYPEKALDKNAYNNVNRTYKPGSMAAKANMVREYNERNSRK